MKGQQAIQRLINSLVEENKKRYEVKPKSYSDVPKSNEDESNVYSIPKEMQSTESQVLSFLNKNGVNLEESEFSACHPMYTKDKSKPPLIVVRFVSRKIKDRVFA